MKTTDELASLRNLIERVRVAMVTTADAAGTLHCRPLVTLELDDDRQLWCLLAAGASQPESLNRAYRQVGIAYADPNKQDYASLSGSGAIVRDPQRMRAHWNAWVELWFPLGIDDPDLAILRVNVERATYWEGPGSETLDVYGAEAASTRAGAPAGETGRHR
jgi:general stress protein 26